MRVHVYRNLKHGRAALPLYSIMHKGRVIDRRHRVLLSGVRFVVRKKGRQRVITEGRKNVHAFVVGDLVDSAGAWGMDADSKKDLPVRVSYNPFKSGHFVDPQGDAIREAGGVLLNERGISACYLVY